MFAYSTVVQELKGDRGIGSSRSSASGPPVHELQELQDVQNPRPLRDSLPVQQRSPPPSYLRPYSSEGTSLGDHPGQQPPPLLPPPQPPQQPPPSQRVSMESNAPPHLGLDGERFYSHPTPSPLPPREEDERYMDTSLHTATSMHTTTSMHSEGMRMASPAMSGVPVDAVGEEARETTALVDEDLIEEQSRKFSRTKASYRPGSLMYCCERVPAPSLIAWILQVVAALGWAVTTYIGVVRSKATIGWVDPEYITLEEILIIVISIATVLVGALLLLVATFSSKALSHRSFNTTAKNHCGRYLNSCLLFLCYGLVLFWVLMCCLLTMPVTILLQLYMVIVNNGADCINLSNYGFYNATSMDPVTVTRDVCDGDLQYFWAESQEILIIFGVALICALLVTVSLINMLLCLSANIRHLREAMLETYAYDPDSLQLNGTTTVTSNHHSPQNTTSNNNVQAKTTGHHELTAADISHPHSRMAEVDLSDVET